MNSSHFGPDRDALTTFLDAIFRYADPDSYIALRAYPDSKENEQPCIVDRARAGDPRCGEWIYNRAKQAANLPAPAVFCSPTSTFKNSKKADQANIAEGLAISVDCDKNPVKARANLTVLLGEPTITAASGGVWLNPETGEVEDKLHLHWRLTEPTRDNVHHARLRRARELACAFVDGDTSAISLVHPLRWPGSVHRKGEPKLARIVAQGENEIDLADALDRLELACPEVKQPNGSYGQHFKQSAGEDALVGDALDIAAALAAIPNVDLQWDQWNKIGMATWKASGGRGFAAFDAWSQKSPKYDEAATRARWAHFTGSPPERIGVGTLFYLAQQAVPGWRKPTLLARDAERAEADPDRDEPGSDEQPKEGEKEGAKASARQSAKPKAECKAKRRDANDTRPVITLRAGAMKDAVDAAEAALIARGGLYQRANQIVSIGEAPVKTHDKWEVTAARIFERGEYALAEDIAEAACVMKFDARAGEEVVVNSPSGLVKTLQERIGRFRLPILTAVINAPTLRPDGSLLNKPGYDAATGLFFDPRGVEFPSISTKPTKGDAEQALADLSELLQGFPFESEADRAVALSTILTACVRQALTSAPLHGFSAPTAGSGKSKLVDIASVIATGREAGVVAQTADDAEMEKRLGALLLEGATAIAIDNCDAPLGGTFLCTATTQPEVSIRILGASKNVTVPTTALLTATGNNLVLVGDMTRRTIMCRLDAGLERPELRAFDFEPVQRAKYNRVRYVVAALTILLAFKAAESPRQATPLGSFDDWSFLVRDALTWIGCADPVATMESARASDPRLSELSELLTQWRSVVGTKEITARHVIEMAKKQTTGADLYSRQFANPDLREALLAVAGLNGDINSKRLGKYLAAHAKRVVDGYSIEHGSLANGLTTWKLVEKRSKSVTAAPARLGQYPEYNL